MIFGYLPLCLLVATVIAELPLFMCLQLQNERVLSPNGVYYQDLPHEHSFGDFLPPSASYGAPTASVNQDIDAADFEIPLEDSYNAAFIHSSSQRHQTGYEHAPTETQVHKHIYVHVPPKDFEQDEDVHPHVTHQSGPKQKHYKIIFIKAPEASNVRTPIVPPLPQIEEKTLIYVLHKKPESELDIVLPLPEPTKPSKPEVYFIKYKNKREEAPVYGPPSILNETQPHQAGKNINIESDNFAPMTVRQNELELTTQQPQLSEQIEQEQLQSKLVTEEPTVHEADFFNNPTQSNLVTEEIQTTTVESLSQHLPSETTLSPIVVKEKYESAHFPAVSYGPPKRNRFFIKRRK